MFIFDYIKGLNQALEGINTDHIDAVIQKIVQVREQQGRLFFLGVGGSAANASHAVNDFRKICGIESYAPTDNVSELTARINDHGWNDALAQWLKGSRLTDKDGLMIFSVGGGNKENNLSVNLIHAMDYAKKIGSTIVGIVGRDGGYTAQVSDACVIVPTIQPTWVTPIAESFQVLIWHLMITDPRLKHEPTIWEMKTNQ